MHVKATGIFALARSPPIESSHGTILDRRQDEHLWGNRVLPFWDGRHSGYRGLLGLHASSLTESLNWSSAEEAGMRALSDITMPADFFQAMDHNMCWLLLNIRTNFFNK